MNDQIIAPVNEAGAGLDIVDEWQTDPPPAPPAADAGRHVIALCPLSGDRQGQCPVCGELIRLTAAGKVGWHGHPETGLGVRECAGYGQDPAPPADAGRHVVALDGGAETVGWSRCPVCDRLAEVRRHGRFAPHVGEAAGEWCGMSGHTPASWADCRPDPHPRRTRSLAGIPAALVQDETRGRYVERADGNDLPVLACATCDGRGRIGDDDCSEVCPDCNGTGLAKWATPAPPPDAALTLGMLAGGYGYPAAPEDERAELEVGTRAAAERFPAGTTITMSHRPTLTLYPNGTTRFTDEWCVLAGPPGGGTRWGKGSTPAEALADAAGEAVSK